jgi:hypothetical protein
MRTSQDRPTESCAAVYVNVTLSRRILTQNQICSTRRVHINQMFLTCILITCT